MEQHRAGGFHAPRPLADTEGNNNMDIKLDKKKVPLPKQGRKYGALAQAVIKLRRGGSLTVPCPTNDEANKLRQVFARLKKTGEISEYRSTQ